MIETTITPCRERFDSPTETLDRNQVRRVCVLLAASRSGSSFLFRLLSRHPDFYSPGGEETPFYRLAGLGWVQKPSQSDRIDPTDVPESALARVANLILQDAGVGGATQEPGLSPAARETYARDVTFRLLLQWPELAERAENLDAQVRKRLMLAPAGPFYPGRFWHALMDDLHAADPLIAPESYDFGDDSSEPRPRAPCAPRDTRYFEEPPFIIPQPRLHARPRDLRERTLLLKTSSNCYRVPLLRRLFPNAEYTFIHLTRNPAGSLNGLMDGWLSGGFHSHNLEGVAELAIPGYTRAEHPWTRRWWKFDLPPDWESRTRLPLEDVCAFQWRSANQAILEAADSERAMLRVRYEDLLNPETLRRNLSRVFSQLSLPSGRRDPIVDPASPVMAVRPPAPGKWKDRRVRLLPRLGDPELREIAQALGYDMNDAESWP